LKKLRRLSVALLAVALSTSWSASGQIYTISTFAGDGVRGFGGDSGPATNAQFNRPQGVAVDSAGSLYIADPNNARIRKVANGVVTTVAGNGGASLGDNGPATGAGLNGPLGVAVDSAGNLYIADSFNNRIRKVSNGVITTIAGNGKPGFSGDNGPATSAQLDGPQGVAVDSAGNIYIADTNNKRIRKVSNGVIATVAGSGLCCTNIGDGGSATVAQLGAPLGIAVDSVGNFYIADSVNDRIRKVSNGVITTFAGNGGIGFSGDNGPATSAQLSGTGGVSTDAAGNVYIADVNNFRVRRVTNGVITTVAGNGTGGFSGDNGLATNAELNQPNGVAVDLAGNLYVADTGNNRIRLLTPGAIPPPSIAQGGIVPVYSTVTTIQPGEWVSIYGTSLAGSTVIWNGDFPISLGGTNVTINGKAAYLLYVSPGQIDLQSPDDAATGTVSVVVTTASGSSGSTVTLAQFGPSFSLLDAKHVAGTILRSNGSGTYGGGTYDILGPTGNSLGYATVAAKAGDTVELFGVGFGPTSQAVPAGQVFSGQTPTTNPVKLLVNNVSVTPSFVGLSSAGLYQINLIVPAGLGTGDVSLVATVGGVQTPSSVVISLQ
jgi:uncharacterized protein (TIGR03437 family)